MVHDLQNHDEITYQLVELDYRGDETLNINGQEVLGRQLREQMLREMRSMAAGPAAPNNQLYRPQEDGLATTFAGFIAAALKIPKPEEASPEEVDRIRQAHLLLSHCNAMQPGVFSLSSWDLVGALPLPKEAVDDRILDGDYRWVNRGGVDLMGVAPDSTDSAFGLPRCRTLYGPLPEQLSDPDSFVSGLKQMLAARSKYDINLSELVAVPDVEEPSICLLVLRPPGPPRIAITALNFGQTAVEERLDLSTIPGIKLDEVAGRDSVDAITGDQLEAISDAGILDIRLDALSGKTLIIEQ